MVKDKKSKQNTNNVMIKSRDKVYSEIQAQLKDIQTKSKFYKSKFMPFNTIQIFRFYEQNKFSAFQTIRDLR